MATDEQGRELSDDGNYYWDGSAWQPVEQGAGTSNVATDEQGRTLSEDGNYYWDGSAWQPVEHGGDASNTDVSSATEDDFLGVMNVETSSEIGAVEE